MLNEVLSTKENRLFLFCGVFYKHYIGTSFIWLEQGANNTQVMGLNPIWAIHLKLDSLILVVFSNAEYSLIL